MKKLILLLISGLFTHHSFAQIGVNATGAVPHTSSMLDVSSTTQGLLMPRMTTAQRTAIATPAAGLMVYDTDLQDIFLYDGTWKKATFTNAPLELMSTTVTPIKGVNSLSGSNNSGVMGETTSSTGGTGVYGVSSTVTPTVGGNWGVYGENLATNDLGYGVYARHWGAGTALQAQSYSGTGVRSVSQSGMAGEFITSSDITFALAGTALGKATAIRGLAIQEGIGVHGVSNTGPGLLGFSGTNNGLYAETNGGTVAAARIVNNNGTGEGVFANNNSATTAAGKFVNNTSNGNALEVSGGIKVSGSNKAAFRITANTAGGGNTSGHLLTIPNTTLANNASDILLVTHNYITPSNTVYLNKAFGVFWNGTNWLIYLEDTTAMPNNAVFNVLVIKQ